MDVALNVCMMLTRHKPRGSKVKTYLFTLASVLILACEIGYLDSLAAREKHACRVGISQESVSNIVFGTPDTSRMGERNQETTNLIRLAYIHSEFPQNSQRR